jgi:hypothetical protein
MSRPVRNVVIVGGGSAGWLTAGIIAAEHCSAKESGLRVTLIESPDIKTIGVGEGTWPSMRDTLRHMGVSETEFVRACDASFKQGSKFVGWVTGGEDEVYYHPFVLPQGYTEANLVARWQSRYPDVPFASLVSFQPHLCENGKAPKQAATPEFAAVANYAYHLDAGKFGEFLKKHCIDKLGVTHILDHVEGVVPAESGDISALETSAHGNLEGDLFIDCTGFAALLIGTHYDVPFVSRKEILFNDSALAVQVPYEKDDSPIASQTTATAQTAGWIWDIGLPTRRGIGHVYSSSHTTDEAAESELRSYVAATSGTLDSDVRPRKITFNPGHRETFWRRDLGRLHRTAGSIGVGLDRVLCGNDQGRDAGQSRRHGHRRRAIQRDIPLSLGQDHGFPEASLCSQPTHRLRLLEGQPPAGLDPRAPRGVTATLEVSAAVAPRRQSDRGNLSIGQLPVCPLRHGLPARGQRRNSPIGRCGGC